MESFRGFSETFGFQLIDELAELVDVYTRLKTERVGHGLYRFASPSRGRLAEPRADRPVNRLLERNPEFARALL